MHYSSLWLRRQFLLTQSECPRLKTWPIRSCGRYRVYAHQDLELTGPVSDKDHHFLLIGFMVDPNFPERSNLEILNDLASKAVHIDDIARYLSRLGGRFVLICNRPDDTYLFHDPCGLRSVFYSRHEGQVIAGSQPSILETLTPLQKAEKYHEFHNSRYKQNHPEHWIPCGITLYENVLQLMPNHYLKFSDLEQVRYWPVGPIVPRHKDEAVHEASHLLKNQLAAMHNRSPLALPLSAGWDSRTLLAASRNLASDVHYYTLMFGRLTKSSSDIRVPSKLLKFLGYPHHIIPCHGQIDPDFIQVNRCTDLSHPAWEDKTWGMLGVYPSERISVKGNCTEIARCVYYKWGSHEPVTSASQLIKLRPGWEELSFIKKPLSNWLEEARVLESQTGVDVLDLFYWEHRMGSWQAQYQLEWDIIQETFTPFNHRGLLEMLLGTSNENRCLPDYKIFKSIIEELWPQTLRLPFNPPSKLADRTRAGAKKALFFIGLGKPAMKIYNGLSKKPSTPEARQYLYR